MERLGLTQPGTSKHLRVLREAGLVRARQEKQQRWYELCPAPLEEVDRWLEPYRTLRLERLKALERHLEASEISNGGSRSLERPDPPQGLASNVRRLSAARADSPGQAEDPTREASDVHLGQTTRVSWPSQ